MKTFERDVWAVPDGFEQLRHLLDVDAELLGPAAHAHAGAFQLEVRVHADSDPCRGAEFGRDGLEQRDFAHRLDVDQHPRGDRLTQLGRALAGAGKADFARVGARVERDFELTRRRDVDAFDQARHQLHERGHRVGLHRVVQLDRGRQRRTQLGHAPAQQRPVVGVERRAADARGEQAQPLVADHEFPVFGGVEVFTQRVNRGNAIG